ncbi:GNAT family N-acetyltransferase [Sulfurimonas sp.]|uniref:GNAT family N-acetyltransferase n=1 Tax=Sulfurimonas sp. TaxID=2022749 RepID=UPI0026276B4A|nr:GNAT family N-acetyltransferase [Sulfurimonas sp.]
MIQIKNIPVEKTYTVRLNVLRPHQSISDCQYDGDTDELTKHFGAYLDNKLIGIVSIYKSKIKHIDDKNCWQIRAMAIIKNIRKKGYASSLLKVAETYALKNGANYIWCNARISAIGFYEKHNYKLYGDEFNVKDIGPHYIMIKDCFVD